MNATNDDDGGRDPDGSTSKKMTAMTTIHCFHSKRPETLWETVVGSTGTVWAVPAPMVVVMDYTNRWSYCCEHPKRWSCVSG